MNGCPALWNCAYAWPQSLSGPLFLPDSDHREYEQQSCKSWYNDELSEPSYHFSVQVLIAFSIRGAAAYAPAWADNPADPGVAAAARINTKPEKPIEAAHSGFSYVA